MKIINLIKKKLTTRYIKYSGRNNQGIITVRHKGGGISKRIRLVDYFHLFFELKAIVLIPCIYDPLRTAFISLILYKNGVFSFMLKPVFFDKGSIFSFSVDPNIKKGSIYPLRIIPEGVFLNSVSFKETDITKIGRSAGSFVYLINKYIIFGNKVLLKLPSGEEYLLNCNNRGTIGRLDNKDHHVTFFKKSG